VPDLPAQRWDYWILYWRHLGQLAQTAGMSENEAANDLADILPDLVNQLTPQGSIPQGGADIESLLRKMIG
jgi:uncharacterized protein YidB (DUF937 family)